MLEVELSITSFRIKYLHMRKSTNGHEDLISFGPTYTVGAHLKKSYLGVMSICRYPLASMMYTYDNTYTDASGSPRPQSPVRQRLILNQVGDGSRL